MLDGDIKEFFKLALPLIGSRFIGVLSGFFSMLMLSRSCIEAAASCALISSLFGFYMATAQAMLSPIGIEYSSSYAKKDFRKSEAIFFHGLLISLCLFVLWLGFLFLIPYMKNIFAIDSKLIIYVRRYFISITPGVFCTLIYLVYSQLLVARTKQLRDALTSALGSIAFFVSFYLFQFINHNTYTGIIFSINISAFILIPFYVYYIKPNQSKIQKTLDISLFKSLIRSGLIIFTQVSGELAAFTIITLLLGGLGSGVLAIQRVLTQVSLIFVISAAAMGQAASVIIAKKRYQFNEKEIGKLVTKMMTIVSAIYFLAIMILLIKKDMINADNIPQELIPKNTALIFTLTLYFDALRHISSGILRGLGNYKLPAFAGLVGLWAICMPSLLFLSHFNLLTFEFTRIMLLIGIFTACVIQLVKLWSQGSIFLHPFFRKLQALKRKDRLFGKC